ncbi:MAG: Hpt domain-containing protein [Kangiellaceae bacterium]|jgi:HPt (histidine-containing phosphotransfer) domain-containing protein|nr:Hpt domain-containing protein [Kangiellaceae bacterium]
MRETVLQLKELLGNDFSSLVEAFDVDNRNHLATIESSISVADAEQVARAAHSIKGAASNLGAEQLTSFCQKLESQAKEGQLSEASDLLLEIKREFEIAVDILKES